MENFFWAGVCVGFWFSVVCIILTSLGKWGLFGQGYHRDGFFCLHPSLTRLWRYGYNEEGKRLNGKVIETEDGEFPWW